MAAQHGPQCIARLQQYIHHGGGGGQLSPAQLVQQGLHLVSQLGDVLEAKGRRATLDRMRAPKDRVEILVLRAFQVDMEQHLLHVVQVLACLLEEDLIELAEVNAGGSAGRVDVQV